MREFAAVAAVITTLLAAASSAAALTPLPTARYGLGAAVVGGRLYTIGGVSGGRPLGTVERYDPGTDTWQALAPMPTARAYFGVAVVGRKIYALGGDDLKTRLSTVEAFDTASGRWERLADVPRRGSGFAVAAVGDSIYVAGGSPLVSEDTVADVSILDTLSGRWTAGPPMTAPRASAGATVLGGRLYVVGGVRVSGGRLTRLSSAESFDPAARSWRVEPGLSWVGSSNADAAGGALFAFGGCDGPRADIDSMAVLGRGSWQSAPPMPTGRSSFASASDGRRIFAVGGSPGRNIELDALEIFDAATRTWRSSRDSRRAGGPPLANAVPARSAPDREDLPSGPPVKARLDDFALVIGLDDYRTVMASEFGRADAEAFARYATARLGVPADNVITLTGERATRTDFAKYIEEWLPRNVGKRSRVYVYYSGHGAPDPEKGDSYLLPWDGDPQFLETSGYPLARLYEKLSALPAAHVVVFLDSCFSGAGGRSVIAKNLRPLVHMHATPVPPRGRLSVLTASGASQVAGGYEAKSHGLFTYYLLKGLDGQAARGAHLDVSQLYDYVRANVRREAHRENREQDPQLLTGEPGLRLY